MPTYAQVICSSKSSCGGLKKCGQSVEKTAAVLGPQKGVEISAAAFGACAVGPLQTAQAFTAGLWSGQQIESGLSLGPVFGCNIQNYGLMLCIEAVLALHCDINMSCIVVLQ